VPGPGAYMENASKTIGKLSQHMKSVQKSFPKELRANPFDPQNSENPGPGNYDYPSEFGVYISKNSPEASKQL